MGGLRFLPLVAIAACADLSGLNGLSVDAAVQGDATQVDAASDASVDAVADTVVDAPVPPVDSSGPTFCQTQTQTYRWCADFDENDVTYGYQSGQKVHWTGWSQNPLPSLSTRYASPPSSAGFDGALAQSLTFTAAPTPLTTYELLAELRIDSANDQSTNVASVSISQSYGIKAEVVHTGVNAYTFTVNEASIGDAGLVITAHPIASFPLMTWTAIDIAISAQKVTAVVGANAPLTFDRAVTGGSQSVTTTFAFDGLNWTGEWDSVRISL